MAALVLARSQIMRALAFALSLLALAATTGSCAAPKRPDTLIVALPTFAEGTFLPWTGGGQRKGFLDPIYDYLAVIDPDTGIPGPGLATDWSVSDDGKQWTFHLREGVQFQRGWGEVTSEDVAFSLKMITSPESRAGPASPLRRLIESIETPDPHTVIINLSRPDPELALGYLANAQQVGIVSAKYVQEVGPKKANAEPVGSGPYELEFYRRESLIRLKIRDDEENLWRTNPQFENLEFYSVPESSTRVAMLKTGEADIAPIRFDDIEDLEASGLRVRSVEQSWSPVVRLGGMVQSGDRYNPDNPWADARVRQAMNLAIDKRAIIDRIFAGEGAIAASDTPVNAWRDLNPYDYDPDTARQLLAEAGYPDGFPLLLKTFPTTPGAELPTVAQAVALFWKAVGIDVEIELIDWTSLRVAWTSGTARDFVWTHRGFPFTSAQNGLEAGFDAQSVFAAYSSPELQAMLDSHAAQLDPDLRRAELETIGQHLRDNAANVFIAHINEPFGISDKVGDWTITASNALNFEGIEKAVQDQ